MSKYDVLVKRLRERPFRHASENELEAAERRQSERVQAADALEAMAGEVASLQNTFDLMWNADQRAIKLWQEATGKDHIWPDKAKTTLWLLERLEAAEAERDRLKAALQPFSDAYERLVRTQESMGFGDNATFGLGIKVSAIKAARKALGGDA